MLKDCWYVGALPNEVTNKPLARRIADEAVVLYRLPNGQVVALEDRCCHRGLPLSMGEAVGDRLRCIYHGLEYNSTGQCVRVPGQDSIPQSARVRAFPVKETALAVWVWVGDAARSREESPPPYPWQDDPAWAWKSGVFYMKCNYELLHDNLLDLSHIAYVHRYTIGGDPEIHFSAKTETLRTSDGVRVVRWMPDSPPPPTYSKLVPFRGRVDRWQEIEFFPGLISLYSGAVDVGTGALEGKREGGFQLRLFDAVTPETATSTHNFFCVGHNFRINEPNITSALYADLEKTVLEDIDVLNAQQQRMSELPGRKWVDLRGDAAGIQARRVVLKLKQLQEQGFEQKRA